MAEIYRRIKNKNYTVMCNHHLQNERLSLKAMGLMSKILSLPDDWNYSVRGIAAICKDGYESVRTAFLELEQEGYIVRQRIRDARGHIVRTEYFILETPDTKIPEEYLVEKVEKKKTLPESEKVEASGQKTADSKSSDQCNGQIELTDILPGSDFPTLVNPTGKSPGSDFPTLVNPTEKSPGSDFPTLVNPTEKSPGSGFPTTENRHQQNTNITNYKDIDDINNNNIYNISSSSSLSSSSTVQNNKYMSSSNVKNNKRSSSAAVDKTYAPVSLGQLWEDEEDIKRRIGYQQLLDDGHDPQLLVEILSLMSDYCSSPRAKVRPYSYIGQAKIPAKEIAVRLHQLQYEQIAEILQHIRHGPEIRNLRNYLLTALYQADLTSRLNKQRKHSTVRSGSKKQNAFNNFRQRDYDYEKLERALLCTEGGNEG